MTKRELNRDVKKLYDEYVHFSFQSAYEFAKWQTEKGVKELSRLYFADTSLESLTADSLRKILHLNLRLRAISLDTFGIYIKL